MLTMNQPTTLTTRTSPAGQARALPADSGQGRTVLIVEDSEIIRRVLGLILEAEGYQVVESADGRAVTSLARQWRPDVITLDLSLPDVDGRELLRELHADPELADLPVVVLSAYADTLTSAERWYAADVIVKPFDLDDLLARLDLVARRAAGERSA